MRILLINGISDSLDEMKSEMDSHYVVDVAHNGADGTYMSQVNDYATIIIESELSDLESSEVCRIARKSNVKTPILMLTEKDNTLSRVLSLDCGADAILSKPPDYREIHAYIRSFVRKNSDLSSDCVVEICNLSVDLNEKRVERAGKAIRLRRKEYELLECLVLSRNKVLSKTQLLESIWEDGICVSSNTLEVHIKSLRDKIDKPFEKQLIKTVYGFGYKLEE